MDVVTVFAMLVVGRFFILVVEHAPFGANPLAGDLLFIHVDGVNVVVRFVGG